ncbi:aldo/keto reductase [Halomonas nitroreducens]|uniref:Aldo/keto reductase n=1 Tax=Halomonas nitroreducens TaxID=447425 RepID=A0A3S0K6C5_9GAMM|nr:aldo/keto reductase [Halomonas nitroreducens]RTR07139.1 aldo/keto reductase [Halomonas nitroreducens]
MNDDSPSFDVPFALGMMNLHEARDLHAPGTLADWIEARLEAGLHWFDHADIYGDRAAETLFGDALRARPGLAKRVRVVTKTSIVAPGRDASPFAVKHYDSSAAYVTAAIDASLERLGVDHLDHFLLHRPDPLMDAETTARALDDAIAAGKIGAAGVSNFLPEAWRRLQAAMTHRLVAHQLQLSLDHAEPLFDGLFDAVVGDGQVPMAWSPLGGGACLQGEAGRLLSRLAEQRDASPAGLALAWLRALPGRPLPVIGSLKAERIATLRRDAAQDLDRASWYALLEAARGHEVA